MNFCIFSIDDSRRRYTDAIRARLSDNFWWAERKVWTVNGNDPEALHWAQDAHRFQYKVNWKNDSGPRKGHLGIWYSVLNALDWELTPIVTFEDDAILHPNFNRNFWDITASLPRDTDAFSLFLPRDQDDVYRSRASELNVSLGICKAYQVYGGVSMLWTPQGAEKFQRLVRRDGIMDQWDNQLYGYARSGEMNVYTQPPGAQILVEISGREPSIVQESELL